MTSIEVPDWVVEIGAEAISKRHLSNTGMPFPIAACREDARAAITAALGAWVVPAPQYYGAAHGGWIDCDSAEQLEKMRMAGHHRVRTLYTLRQEKPE